MVGAFNARYDAEQEIIVSGDVGASDIEGLVEGERYAVYAHYAQALRVMHRNERLPVTLKPLECEVFTFMLIVDGLAPIGLTEMFNAAHAVLPISGTPAFGLNAGGSVLAWCEKEPVDVKIDGVPVDFTYDPADQGLRFTAPALTNRATVWIQFTRENDKDETP